MPSENPQEPGKRLSDFFNKVSKVIKDALAVPEEQQQAPFQQPAPSRREKKKPKPTRFQL